MAEPDSEFWRNLAKEFRELPSADLRADWSLRFEPGSLCKWELRGGTYSIQVRFRTLCIRAGTHLVEDAADFLSVWLDAIKSERGYRELVRFVFDETPSTKTTIELGSISNVCGASADHCYVLEARALESERMSEEQEKRRNDPRNWPEIVQQYEVFKSIRKLISGPHEEIPEEVLRNLVAQQDGIKPEDVTFDRLKFAATQLFQHYPAITVVPAAEVPVSSEQASTIGSASLGSPGDADEGDQVAIERCASLRAFKDRARAKGITVTDVMVAKAAKKTWNTRTMVTWWKRNDPRCKPIHDKLIRAALAKDPVTLWSSK